MAGQQPPTPPTGAKGSSPWVEIILALFMCAGSFVIYFYLADKEATGESFSMNYLAVLLYKIGGKWLLAGLSAAFGLLLLVVGVTRLVKSKK